MGNIKAFDFYEGFRFSRVCLRVEKLPFQLFSAVATLIKLAANRYKPDNRINKLSRWTTGYPLLPSVWGILNLF